MRLRMLMEAFCCCFDMGGGLMQPVLAFEPSCPYTQKPFLHLLFILKQSLTNFPKLAWIDDPPVSASGISQRQPLPLGPAVVCVLETGRSCASRDHSWSLAGIAGWKQSSHMWPCTLGLRDTFNINFSFQNKLWQVLVIWCGSNSQEQCPGIYQAERAEAAGQLGLKVPVEAGCGYRVRRTEKTSLKFCLEL